MAAGQPLLSLFSCPIRRISEKHNRAGPQGTGKAPVCRRHDRPGPGEKKMDRNCRRGHSVLPRADHVIMSSKKKREIAATDEDHGLNVTEWSTVETLMCERNNIHLRSAHGGNYRERSQSVILHPSRASGEYLTSVRISRLLRQQHAGEHLLPRVRVHVRLEGEERLGLVLRHPQGLQRQHGQRERQVLEPGEGWGGRMWRYWPLSLPSCIILTLSVFCIRLNNGQSQP